MRTGKEKKRGWEQEGKEGNAFWHRGVNQYDVMRGEEESEETED